MENYLMDVLDQLIETASQIKADSEFESGRLHGYYETISKLLNQAESFGLSEKLPERLRNYRSEDLLNSN
jgi:hypothetical protein